MVLNEPPIRLNIRIDTNGAECRYF
ncbi:hypothetical protein CBM2629_A170107 [Cupriavidus taiwanensis]|nr:hypothetical protein CBM2629_A170107 [Cupriavidus taiwanensis]